jgi:hypothetical protein
MTAQSSQDKHKMTQHDKKVPFRICSVHGMVPIATFFFSPAISSLGSRNFTKRLTKPGFIKGGR